MFNVDNVENDKGDVEMIAEIYKEGNDIYIKIGPFKNVEINVDSTEYLVDERKEKSKREQKLKEKNTKESL